MALGFLAELVETYVPMGRPRSMRGKCLLVSLFLVVSRCFPLCPVASFQLYPPSKRGFRIRSGIGRDVRSDGAATFSAREVSPGVFHCFPLFPVAIFQLYPPSKRSFGGPGWLGRDLGFDEATQIFARVKSSCCLPLSPFNLL